MEDPGRDPGTCSAVIGIEVRLPFHFAEPHVVNVRKGRHLVLAVGRFAKVYDQQGAMGGREVMRVDNGMGRRGSGHDPRDVFEKRRQVVDAGPETADFGGQAHGVIVTEARDANG